MRAWTLRDRHVDHHALGPLWRLIAPIASLALILGGGTTAAVAAASPAAAAGPYQLIPEYGAYPANLTGSNLTPQQMNGENIWHHLCDTATTTSGNATSVIIANVDNGPGNGTDSNWNSALSYCINDHVTTVGYVPTYFDTGKKPDGTPFTIADAEAMIDEWVSAYGNNIQGIFFDQVATSNTTANQNYYATLAAYARSKFSKSLIVYNPGTSSPTTSWMIKEQQANLVDVFESGLSAFEAWTPPAWVTRNAGSVAATVYQDAPPTGTASQIAAAASQDASSACTTLQKDGLDYGVMWSNPQWTSDATNVTGNGIWDDYRADGC